MFRQALLLARNRSALSTVLENDQNEPGGDMYIGGGVILLILVILLLLWLL
jgi:hypothetical protein